MRRNGTRTSDTSHIISIRLDEDASGSVSIIISDYRVLTNGVKIGRSIQSFPGGFKVDSLLFNKIISARSILLFQYSAE
jgi:hypothetical protein